MYRIIIMSLLLMSASVEALDAPSAPDYQIKMEQAWITMPDGVRLAADLFMPDGDVKNKNFPVLLEYLPYRKDESRQRNHSVYSYFVERGYVVARVDIRGTGNSEGLLIPYEYSDQELDDGEVVIDWLSRQSWSNGNIGIFGISWGGFNSIQLAVRNPPALKAFIAVCATEDLYQDDVHYMDGIIHMDSWMMAQDLYNAMPGAPEYRIDEDFFRNHFDTEPTMFTYMRQQRDGPFWDRASARDKYDQIKIPGFHIGGWYDGYRDSLPRMLENVSAPVKALIGPWDHYFPHNAAPKPAIEWRHEAVRWFDQWLKGKQTGIMDEPRFAVYVRDWHPPGPTLEHAPGKWRWEAGWPIERARTLTLFAQDNHTLSAGQAKPATHRLRYKASSGVEAGGPVMWWGSIAHDQRPTDAFSLVYDSDPLTEELEILGIPRALLRVSADASQANWYVRVSDVAPDGSVTQVSGAGLNGTHRISARQPQLLEPGKEFPLDIEMHFTSWVFPKGHRIRFAISNAQWPMLWPTPYRMSTTLALGGDDGARLKLPQIPSGKWDEPVFKEPVDSPLLPGYETIDSGNVSGYGEISSVDRDPRNGDATAIATNTGGTRYPWGVEAFEEHIEHKTSDSNPAKTSAKGVYALQIKMEERTVRLEAEVEFRSDLENFHLSFIRRLKENGEVIREKNWNETIPRDHQ